MHAITFAAVEQLVHERVADPVILDPGDVIVAVDAAGVCGSDLHPYLGREGGLDAGTVMGHEFVGRIVETGAGVRALRTGDRVVAPFTTSCGECAACTSGLTSRCAHGQLFGWVQDGRGLHGAQAGFVRVPLADTTLVPVPAALGDDALALLAGDVLATGMFGAELARVNGGDVVAVVGCGAVGLLAIRAALARGAHEVFALDAVHSRLALAERFGATPVAVPGDEAVGSAGERTGGGGVGPAHEVRERTGGGGVGSSRVARERTGGRGEGSAHGVRKRTGDRELDAVAFVHERTDGRGVDAVIEAVGSPGATRAAADIARVGAVIAAVGVHTEPHLALSPGELYDRNLTYAAGRCPARRLLPDALAMAQRDAALLAALISHRLPLADGVEAYRRLAARAEGWAKVVLLP